MRACLYIGPRNNGWVGELLPGKSPGELPILGQSWCRHVAGLCSQLKIDRIYIADVFYYPELTTRLGDGSYWDLRIDFRRSEPAASPQELLAQHRGAIPEDDLLIFWGQVLPDLPEPELLLADPQPVGDLPADGLPDGIYLLRGGRLLRCPCPLHRMDSPQAYFDLNFRLLREPGIYTIPGYSPAHDGIYFGQNLVTMPNARIRPTTVIRGNCFLGRSVQLNGDVIISDDVVIDDYTVIKHSIILGNTYVGRNMWIENKVFVGNRVIDMASGAFVDLNDPSLADKAKVKHLDTFTVIETLSAMALSVALLPWYLAARLLPVLTRLPFFRYVRRVYPPCIRVFFGRASLVRIGTADQHYAFRYSDQWTVPHTVQQKKMGDTFFLQHRSVRLMLAVVVRSLLLRLFILSEPSAEGESQNA